MRDGLLLCELRAHTTWSDGELTLPELVDLYGRSGFDVLCVTDHAVRLDDPAPRAVDSWTWPAYTAAVRAEAERGPRRVQLPPVATGDAHRSDHLATWKTLLPCERDPAAVIEHLRSRGRVFLTPFALERRLGLPIAA